MVIELTDENIIKLTNPYEVRYLYKYRSMKSEGLEEIFTLNEIFIPDPTRLNDPFDCKPRLVLPFDKSERETFIRKKIKEEEPKAKRQTIRREARIRLKELSKPGELERRHKEALRGFGVYCLSEVSDDILMWSHYSDSHRGICLKFRADKVFTLFFEAWKVTYQEEYPEVDIMKLRDTFEIYKSLAIKSNHWKYEKERRIVKTSLNEGGPGLNERGPGIYKYQPELLEGVILGALISDTDKSRIEAWVDNHSTPITIYQATLDKKNYKLNINRL